MSNGTATPKDQNYWRGQADAHFADLKEGQEKIHTCLKKHIEQTENRLNGLEQKTAVHSTNIKIHWLLIAVVLASLLGLGVRAAFGMVEPDRDTVQFYEDGSIRYDYSFKLIAQDTASFGPFRVKDYRSFGLYLRAEGTDSIHLAAIHLQSDIQDSVFARVDGYSVIDTTFTDSAIAYWYAVYPSGLTYITYYVYGNAGNDASDSCSVRLRLLFSTWKGTMRTIPGTGVYVHHHDEFVGDIDIHGFVNFYADSIEQGRPALVCGYNSNFAYLYPDPGRGALPGQNMTFNLGNVEDKFDTTWFNVINTTKIKFGTTVYLSAPAAVLTLSGIVDLIADQTNTVGLGTAAKRWKGIHGRSVFADTVTTTFASIDNLLATVVSKDATAALTVQPGSYAFNVDGYPFTGLFFNSNGYMSFMGDNDEFFRTTLLGTHKGDVAFYDNAATPVRHMWWDASTQKLYLGSGNTSHLDVSTTGTLRIFATEGLDLVTDAGITDHIRFNARLCPAVGTAPSIGSGLLPVDTVYAADFAVTSSMFSGSGAEALSILETVQALPGDRLDHEAIHPYLTPSSPNTVSLNRWIALLTVAVQELGKKNIELAQRIEELSR